MTARTPDLTWWLIYGPGRSGTTYLTKLASYGAARVASDWGLGAVLAGLDRARGIDKARYLQDLRDNVLASARPMGTRVSTRLDLVYKQAGIDTREYGHLCAMFGPPQRAVFCMRAPESYMASAVKKFPHLAPARLQDIYRRMFAEYRAIGGDIIHYGPDLDLPTLRAFLRPLALGRKVAPFDYKGEERPDLASPAMRADFEAFRAEFCPGAYALRPLVAPPPPEPAVPESAAPAA
jgi:hypothetical protein